ncbi:MAG: Hsp33 family molecular chaperone HslO [Caldicoprobacterales bacterium]|jgi:molecular chaperone Hsp33|nr:Hsp33 family molecular chaperone HslO [Clostridiales bacterium]
MDYVVRGVAGQGSIRAFAVRTTQLVSQAAKIHGLYPVAAAALGRVLTAAGMMAVDMKNSSNVLSIVVKGTGPLGSIVSVAKADGTLKGYVDYPQTDLPLNEAGKLDVGSAVGREGKLTVIKDLGLKEPYVGQIDLVSGEIGEDIANYFWASEQQPSAVALGVLINPDLSVKAAGGYIIQPLPDADEEIINRIEKKIAEVPAISTLVEQGRTPEEILEILLGEFELKLLGKTSLKFKCDCNRERLERVVLGLGKEELEDIIQTEGEAELTCHYCNTKYHFSKEQLESLLAHA